MALFRRKRPDDAATQGETAPTEQGASGQALSEPARSDNELQVVGDEEPNGPYDSAALLNKDGYVDLGAVWLPAVQGLMLTMEVNDSTGEITAVRVHLGDSLLQLQAFAAPRSSGIWPEIRDEIAQGLPAQGGTCESIEGHFGEELLARVPTRGPDGRTTTAAMRFVGIDGPRWFLRGVISGPAALDATLAQSFIDLLRISAVYRDGEPRAPRELLPLQFPDESEAAVRGTLDTDGAGVEAAAQPPHGDADASDVTAGRESRDGRRTDDLRPFERGPEITEIR